MRIHGCDCYPAVLLPERPGHELDWKVSFDETRSGGKLICSIFTCHEDPQTHTLSCLISPYLSLILFSRLFNKAQQNDRW